MKINISACGSKEWLDYKSDIVFGLYNAFTELNHDTTVTINSFTSQKLNIIVGADFLPGTGAIEKIIENKVEYIVYEIENYARGVVNNRENFQSAEYTYLLQNAKLIVTPYKKNWLQLKSEGFSNLAYVQWGYYPGIEENGFIKSKKPQYKAVFFGLIKGDRISKIKDIVNHHGESVKIISTSEPHTFLDYYISQSRWGLNLSYGITEEFVNPFRIYRMIANRIPVLSDAIIDLDGYARYCTKCSSSEVIGMLNETPKNDAIEYNLIRGNRLSENIRALF